MEKQGVASNSAAEAASPQVEVTDVTNSVAYTILNTLVDEGQIPEERADYLKEMFKDLHTRVLLIYKRDNVLLKRARQLRDWLEEERQRIYNFGDTARKDDEVIQALKHNLMEHERDLAAALERESVLQVETLEYDRRKQHLILEREDAIAAEEARLRPKMESMQEEIKTMGNHIKELAADVDKCTAEQNALIKEEEEKKEEIENFAAILTQAKNQLAHVQGEPARARKQLDLVLENLFTAQRELSNTEDRISAQAERIQTLEVQRNSRAEDYESAKKRLQTLRSEIDAKRKTLATMNTSLEVELETRQAAQERVSELEQLILTTKVALQQEEDSLERIEREREKCVRQYNALERGKEDAHREEEFLKEQIHLVQKEQEQVARTTAHVEKEIRDYRKDAEARTKKLLAGQAKSKEFVEKAERILLEIRETEEAIAVKTKQDDVRRRELGAIIAKKEEFTRACAREATRLSLAQRELQRRDVCVKEAQRRYSELEKRLKKVLFLFHKVKQDRAKKIAQIQTIAQVMSQVVEKTKLLDKEIAVLTRESTMKDQEIVKAQVQVHELTNLCSNLRLDKNRHRKNLEKALDSDREVKAQVRRLNADIAAAEDAISGLRHDYAVAVESRNHTGIQLIDRNDEAALLVARIKAQEAAIAEGTRMTNDRAQEVRALKVKMGNLLHDIEACQQAIPKVTQMELELIRVREDIEAEQWRSQVLNNDLTDPKNPHRWNRISLVFSDRTSLPAVGGAHATTETSPATQANAVGESSARGGSSCPDDTVLTDQSSNDSGAAPAQALVGGPSEEYVRLQARCQELETRVQRLNSKLHEKNLILAEVTELAERVGGQADSGKECTLALARQINKYHSNIRSKSRQMMSTVAELSLFQASSIQLQQEVQRLEAVVEEAEDRLEAGEAPYAEAETHYERERQCQLRYTAARRRQRLAARESEASLGKQVTATTAVPRPNAYVPQDDDLGLPRPYGPFAPFKGAVHRVTGNPPRAEAWGSTPLQQPSPALKSVSEIRGATVPLSASSSPPGTSAGAPSHNRGFSTPPIPPLTTRASAKLTNISSYSSSVPTRHESRASTDFDDSGATSAEGHQRNMVAAPQEQVRVSQRSNSSSVGGASSRGT